MASRFRLVVGEQPCRPAVQLRALPLGHLLVERRSHRRMNEAQWTAFP